MKTMFTLLLCLLFGSLFSQTEKGAAPLNPQSAIHNPQSTRAVVIGISDYQDKDIPDLRFADRDAEAFANYLRSPAGGSLDGDHLKLLTNEKATAGRIAEALDGLIEQAKEGDEVIIYFSGHGDVERKKISQPGFLLCWDSPSRVYMGGGTYSLAFLQEVVTTLSVQNKAKVTVITDACHAGKLAGSQIGGAQLTSANLAKQYANEVKILSCQPGEFSLEGEQWGGGRGVFSYHLVDGLFGLADRNGDGTVTVGEIDRYLEDHVTAEAAPQSQVPMLMGNKTDRLATVSAVILAELKKAKATGMHIFAATESRGFEDEVLAKLDSGIIKRYFAFKKALTEKRFFPDSSVESPQPSADELHALLTAEPGLTPLYGIIKRNYAAALQDDAQQAMNIWLKADVEELQCIGQTLKLQPIPRQLGRAAELLGENHYMYSPLLARKLLFEGIILSFGDLYQNDSIGNRCLDMFRKSSSLEPNSPLPWHQMALTYVLKLNQAEAAFECAEKARELAPNWVLPFTDLNLYLLFNGKTSLAEKALQAAEVIDSLHPYVFNRRARWYSRQPTLESLEKAKALFEKYRESGGPMYSCWYTDYGRLLANMGLNAEAEVEFWKAITTSDSMNYSAFNEVGMLYLNTKRYPQAEKAFLKCNLLMDSKDDVTWNNLGVVYLRQELYGDAIEALEKSIELNANYSTPHKHLGTVYWKTNKIDLAEKYFQKAVDLEPEYAGALLGLAYVHTLKGTTKLALNNVELAIKNGFGYQQLTEDPSLLALHSMPEWKALMKKYFPNQAKD